MSRTVGLAPADAERDGGGVLRSPRYADVYHSVSGAIAQARHVFLEGCGLPDRWQHRARFTVLETGFGCGLNFLATWAAWRADPQRCAHLHFVSVEKHPFTASGLVDALAPWTGFADLARELVALWPPAVAGFHDIALDGGRVRLLLLLGDALELLPGLRARVDAFYLDGFSPDRNPEMWSERLFSQVSRLAESGATAATWSAAAVVRAGLTRAGFHVERRPGLPPKRDMTVARRERPVRAPGELERPLSGRSAVVIGAGIAGACCAQALAACGWSVVLLERHAQPAREASGNPAGVLRPIIAQSDNRLARLARVGFLHTARTLQAWSSGASPLRWDRCGVLQLARDGAREDALRAVVAEQHLPADFARYVDRDGAAALAGWDTSSGGLWFPGGGWVQPPSLVESALAESGSALTLRTGVQVAALERDPTAATWIVRGTNGAVLAEGEAIVLAVGTSLATFAQSAHLPSHRARGQVTSIPLRPGRTLRTVVTRRGYVTPAVDGWHCAGASFDEGRADPAPDPEDDRDNLGRIADMLDRFIDPGDSNDGRSRVAFRPLSPDRRPFLGMLPCAITDSAPAPTELRNAARHPGIFVAGGYGSRGLVWCTLGARLLAARIDGAPMPLEGELLDAIDPARFVLSSSRRR